MVSVSGAPIRDQRGKCIGTVMVVRDITEMIKMHQELLKASKLESLEVLAGGIAHDFNNLMTVVLGNVTLTRLLLDENHEANPLLIEAEKAVNPGTKPYPTAY
jgi:two-component system cell cycle sensor histidine kinase/response regulator CckA